MRITPSDLGRFQLKGLLGEGAEFQAFAAFDSETGQPVVVKRPHPALIQRGQHRRVEARVARLLDLRDSMAASLPHVVPLVAYSLSDVHDEFFGDSMGSTYTVMVEERARGLPLVGSTFDGITGKAIGLPQNLFALHPIVTHGDRGPFPILNDVLELARAFCELGLVLLDLRPQNIVYDPLRAATLVIDVGSVDAARPATNRLPAVDLHDFYLELFRWYVAACGPPAHPEGYLKPSEVDSASTFHKELDAMIPRFSNACEPIATASTAILEKIRERGYSDLNEFESEFRSLLRLIEDDYQLQSCDSSLVDAWRKAAAGLRDPYWRKFLFDADHDLARYE